MVCLTVLPVTLYLLRPASIPFPGIQRWINTGATASRGRCFRYPPAILLPSVGIRVITGIRRTMCLIRDFISRCVVFAVPGYVLAILHVNVLVQSFEERYLPQALNHRNCITEQIVIFYINIKELRGFLLNDGAQSGGSKGGLTEYRHQPGNYLMTR